MCECAWNQKFAEFSEVKMLEIQGISKNLIKDCNLRFFNPNRPGLNSKQERLGQGYHNPALESSYPRFLSWWREGRGFESRRGQVLFLFHYIRSKVFNFLGDILLGHNVFDCTIINFKTDWPENFVKYTWKKTGFFLEFMTTSFQCKVFKVFFKGKKFF